MAGTITDENSGALAIPKGEHRLKFRWLPSKALAARSFKGHDDIFAPPGPASTLFPLKRLPPDLLQIVKSALRETGIELQFPVGSALEHIVAQVQELPESERVRVKREIEQVVRSAALRPRVCKLWGYACAACGVSLSDGAGNFECQVAHIREVWDDGKDLINNSLPLCRTHHWAFDQHIWGIKPNMLVIEVRKDFRQHPLLKSLHAFLIN